MKRALVALGVLVAVLALGEIALRIPRWIVFSPFDEAGKGRLTNSPSWPQLVPFEVDAAPSGPRIVYVGASTEAGLPYGPKLSPPRWLEQILRWRGMQVEVVQLAGPGLTSSQTADLLPFALELQPDAVVVGVGHNEYLLTGELLERRWWTRSELARRLATVLDLGGPASERLPTPKHDFDREAVHAGFRRNLRVMQAAADEANVPLLFTLPASNLADSPPVLGDDPRLAEPPDAAWKRGGALLAAGDVVAARAAFETARDTDRWPHRATGPLLAILAEEARQVVPVDRALELASERGVPGFDLFADHCHPNPEGQRVLSLAVADAIEDLGSFPFTGRRGQGPSVGEMMEAVGYDPADLVKAHAVVGRGYMAFALVTGRWGALAELAEASLDAAYSELDAYVGELDSSYALLALLKGDVPEARRRLDAAHAQSPDALVKLERGHRAYPWVRRVFERNGLTLRDGMVVELPAPGRR